MCVCVENTDGLAALHLGEEVAGLGGYLASNDKLLLNYSISFLLRYETVICTKVGGGISQNNPAGVPTFHPQSFFFPRELAPIPGLRARLAGSRRR